MSKASVDFLVVGGGPSGCGFAMLSARAGASVALIERDDYRQPRPGEHLAGRVRPLLDALGVPKADTSAIAGASAGIVSLWDGAEPFVKHYRASGQPTGLSVVRQCFDELLCRSAREAGAMVVSRARPARIERIATGAWRVTVAQDGGDTREIVARSLVDASGRSAYVARSQGAVRVNHGDLLAIVRWLDVGEVPAGVDRMLTVESCAHGWWSLSTVAGTTLVATLYTSASMMKAGGAAPETWWTRALTATRAIGPTLRACTATVRAARVYAARPSRSSLVAGNGWIAIGDAAIALDPVAGQGVSLALETAFRAFEAAAADPSFSRLGDEYRDALYSRLSAHLAGRADVYAQAAAVLPRAFFRSAVSTSIARQQPLRAAHG